MNWPEDHQYITGQTPLNEEARNGLKIKIAKNWDDINKFEELNIQKAVEWSIKSNIKGDSITEQKFIRKVHERMFNDVWTWAGNFRRTETNIGVEWTQIPIQLQSLSDDVKYWIINGTYSEDEIAIRFKHRMVVIHPFLNGNGRHSRLMADLLINKVFNKPVFSWGGSDLGTDGTNRKVYLNAIYQANDANYQPLLEFARNNIT